jgi:hypothetical protein
MDAMKSILVREIERLNTLSQERPLSKDEIVNLDKLASAWNKYYGKDLSDPGSEVEELSIEDAILLAQDKS